MESDEITGLIEGIVDDIVGEIWWELSDVLRDGADTDGVHIELVGLIRDAVKKGIKIGRME
jgi:hypothetical protein